MNIISYLKQPFPKAENKWRTILLISLFVTLFLFIFQPFGIGQIESHRSKYLFIGGFGAVSFGILVFNLVFIEHLFSGFFNDKNWRLYKELFWLFCIVFSIGLGNVIYVIIFSGIHLTLNHVIQFQIMTLSIAVFPVSIFTISKYNYLVKKYSVTANDVNGSIKKETERKRGHSLIQLFSYNEKTSVEFDLNELISIESKGNDIEINLIEDKHIRTITLRNTLKKSLEQLSDFPELFQCHRAFIVNLTKVKQVEGNSQGLVLKFKNCEAEVPVSRRFVSNIKSELKQGIH